MNGKGTSLGGSLAASLGVVALLLAACGSDENGGQDGESATEGFPTDDVVLLNGFPGGNYEAQGRGFAPVFDAHLDASGTVGVENVDGGGGLIAFNQAWNAEPDGHTLAIESTHGTALRKIANGENAEWDPAEWRWVGGWFAELPAIGVGPDLGVSSWSDLVAVAEQDGLAFGTPGVGTVNHGQEAALANAIGFEPKFVHYESTSDVRTALGRGEVDAYIAPVSTVQEVYEAGELSWMSVLSQGDYEPEPEFETIDDLEAATELVPDERELLIQMVGAVRGIIAPPDIPEENLEVLREAFTSAAEDEEWTGLLETEGIAAEPVQGADLDEFMDDFWPGFESASARLFGEG